MKSFIVLLAIVFITSCKSNQKNNLPQESAGRPIISFPSANKEYIRFSKELNYVPYYLQVYEADSLIMIGKNVEAYEKLNKLFKLYEPLNEPNYEEYKNYLKISYLTNNKSKIKQNTLFFIRSFGYTYKQAKRDSIMNLIFKEYEIGEDIVSSENQKFLQKVNVGLRDTLVEIYKQDQYYRINIGTKEKIDSIDKVHEKLLVKIFRKYGVPDWRVIGSLYTNAGNNSYANLFYIPLLHTRDSIRCNYFIPLLKKAVMSGKFSPANYANMIDQFYLYNDKKQLYGSYLGANYKIAPVQNEKKLDSLRKSIGLPSVSNYLWKNREYIKQHNN